MTDAAQRFVGATTFRGITGREVALDMFDAPGELHVRLASACRLLLVAPATADAIARLAQGRADDVLTATALCFLRVRAIAPAMHPRMWEHPATQRNVATLRNDGFMIWGPAFGEVASGENGEGRLLEPAMIVEAVATALSETADLHGKRVIVSAGPTQEAIDAVRFLSNRSSGKMGFALAERAAARGASVDLVAGPVRLPVPAGVKHHPISTAAELLTALREQLATPCDALFMTAAVGDYRAASLSEQKLERRAETHLHLVANPDIIATLAQELHDRGGSRPLLIAFALETGSDEEVVQRARLKRARKGVDVVVANIAQEALGADENRVFIIRDDEPQAWPRLSKRAVADRLLSALLLDGLKR
jgi:phosphopantothenoylcysteine decarboxylase/phosphopantothenate--cysteine ligase